MTEIRQRRNGGRRTGAAFAVGLLLTLAPLRGQVPEQQDPPTQAQEAPSAESPPKPSPAPARLEPYIPDSQRPEVELEFLADVACALEVDGVALGEAPAAEPVRFPVKTGKRLIKARSLRDPEAAWSRIVTVREDRAQTVRVRLQREVEALVARQRRESLYRDADRELMWARRDNGADVRWVQAREYCDELRLADLEDWRLPTVEELRSLQALWSQAGLKVIGAITLSGCCPWSSDAAGEEKAWNFDYRSRRAFAGHRDYSLGLRALCVRAYPEEEQEAERQRIEERRQAAEARKAEEEEAAKNSEPPPEPPEVW